jgi:hypothetical protein
MRPELQGRIARTTLWAQVGAVIVCGLFTFLSSQSSLPSPASPLGAGFGMLLLAALATWILGPLLVWGLWIRHRGAYAWKQAALASLLLATAQFIVLIPSLR